MAIPVRDDTSLSSGIPSGHPLKQQVESAVRAVLDAQGGAWDCAIVALSTGAWLVTLGRRSSAFECGFRVATGDQTPERVSTWVARMTALPLDVNVEVRPPAECTVEGTSSWPQGGFATYEERRAPPGPGMRPYRGVERRRAAQASSYRPAGSNNTYS